MAILTPELRVKHGNAWGSIVTQVKAALGEAQAFAKTDPSSMEFHIHRSRFAEGTHGAMEVLTTGVLQKHPEASELFLKLFACTQRLMKMKPAQASAICPILKETEIKASTVKIKVLSAKVGEVYVWA